jgi:hypothetical protein
MKKYAEPYPCGHSVPAGFEFDVTLRCIALGRSFLVETVTLQLVLSEHDHKLVSAFELDGMSVAIVSLYAFVKLISRYERHYLSEYGLSLIHDFYLLQYYLQKYKIKSRKNFIRVMH